METSKKILQGDCIPASRKMREYTERFEIMLKPRNYLELMGEMCVAGAPVILSSDMK